MKRDNPKISIITVVYNREKYIENTIKSVLNQTYKNIEYIIIDGGSTDGTVDIIKKYGDKIDYWVSEKDNGIYDAMNKGLKVATGDYIAILNADDYYIESAVELSIKKILETNSDYSIANVKFIDGSIIKPIIPLENKIYQEMPYPHVSAFISKKVYEKVGFFDTDLKIAGDHDMAIRIILNHFKYCYVDETIAFLEKGGISNSIKSNLESYKVAVKNGKNIFSSLINLFLQILKQSVIKIIPTIFIKKIQKMKGSRFVN